MKKVRVLVKPSRQQQNVEVKKDQFENDMYVVDVKSSAHDDKANRELVEVLSNFLNLAPSDVSIKSGHGSRIKIIALGS